MTYARFMSRPIGRIIKAVLGLVLTTLAFKIGGMTGMASGLVLGMIGVHHVVAIIGLFVLAAGAFNFCPLAPFVGGYFDGRKNLEGTPPTTPLWRRGAPQH
jgi:hypothetical protein